MVQLALCRQPITGFFKMVLMRFRWVSEHQKKDLNMKMTLYPVGLSDTVPNNWSHWQGSIGAAGSSGFFTSQPARCTQVTSCVTSVTSRSHWTRSGLHYELITNLSVSLSLHISCRNYVGQSIWRSFSAGNVRLLCNKVSIFCQNLMFWFEFE